MNQRPSQLSQFMSSNKKDPQIIQNTNVVDPFNESMSGHIGLSNDQACADHNMMQDAIENLDLNPPPEFLDALSWDRPSVGSGSVMKFSDPYSLLTSEQVYQ